MSRAATLFSTRLALYAAALLAAWVIGPLGAVYWDSFSYVGQAASGHPGGLALGRPLFVFASHAAVQLLQSRGVSVFEIEPWLRALWLLVSALAAPATHALALACGLGAPAAVLAGLAVALSPAMAHTSRAVLTDAPSLALSVIACALAARTASREDDAVPRARLALALGAGLALGAAFGLREQAVVQALTLALLAWCAPRGLRVGLLATMALGFVLSALPPVLYACSTQPGYLRFALGWAGAMRAERSGHPYTLRDALFYLAWLVAMGPATLAAAALGWRRAARSWLGSHPRALAVAAPALAQLGLLALYPDIAYSPRYLLPALPGALALPAAAWGAHWVGRARVRRLAALAALVLPVLIAAPLVRAHERPLGRTLATLPGLLARVPTGALVATGEPCPAVEMYDELARASGAASAQRPRYRAVCPGWSWPAEPSVRFDAALREGAAVVLDLREASWPGTMRRELAQVERYARMHSDAVTAGRIVLWR